MTQPCIKGTTFEKYQPLALSRSGSSSSSSDLGGSQSSAASACAKAVFWPLEKYRAGISLRTTAAVIIA
jgi:hypothetical protein